MKPYKQENEKARRPRKKGMQDEAGYEKKQKTLSFSWTMLPFYPVLSMPSQPNVHSSILMPSTLTSS